MFCTEINLCKYSRNSLFVLLIKTYKNVLPRPSTHYNAAGQFPAAQETFALSHGHSDVDWATFGAGGGGAGATGNVRVQSTTQLTSDSAGSLAATQWPWGSVRREIVTSLFESMLDSIVDSWEVISPPKYDEFQANMEFGKTPSEITVGGKKKDKKPASQYFELLSVYFNYVFLLISF